MSGGSTSELSGVGVGESGPMPFSGTRGDRPYQVMKIITGSASKMRIFLDVRRDLIVIIVILRRNATNCCGGPTTPDGAATGFVIGHGNVVDGVEKPIRTVVAKLLVYEIGGCVILGAGGSGVAADKLGGGRSVGGIPPGVVATSDHAS